MLMFEMLTGLPPWYTKDRQKLFERLRSAPLVIPKGVSAPASSIIQGLLTRNPSKRLGTHGALQVCLVGDCSLSLLCVSVSCVFVRVMMFCLYQNSRKAFCGRGGPEIGITVFMTILCFNLLALEVIRWDGVEVEEQRGLEIYIFDPANSSRDVFTV